MKKNIKTSSYLFTILLAVAFIVLKLCHVINWSWWWMPLIITSIITFFENRG